MYVLWGVYGILVGGWFLAFAITEFWFWLKVNRGSNLLFNRGEKTDGKKGRLPGKAVQEFYDFHAVSEEKTQFYTWEEVDSLVGQGQILVIANGRYIYDASKWISSHPGISFHF